MKYLLVLGQGIHFCLDAPLARLEVNTVLRGVFERFPGLELSLFAEGL